MPFAARVWICLVASLAIAAGASAREFPSEQLVVDISLDSGFVKNTTEQRAVIFSTIVEVPEVASLRLIFDEVILGQVPAGGQPTLLCISSLLDGGLQTLNATHVEQWQYTSAYFNGSQLLVEIVADPAAGPSRVVATHALTDPTPSTLPESICGPTDDRILCDDPRVARFYPGRCSIFIIDDPNHCLLTAGHCDSYLNVVEFNCPLSDPYGTPQHPGPEDQYAYDTVSVQSSGSGGVGNDWCYFGCFENTQTGLTPYEAQGNYFVLAQPAPPAGGQEIRITGYGSTSPPIPDTWNRVEKTHVGPYVQFIGTTVRYETDTTGGNSGSPVIFEDTGEVIGIHTHAGCYSTGGSNPGTGLNHPGLQYALANPLGVCIPVYDLGDLNCDGVLNAFDIDPFVLALTDPAGYTAAWPDCDINLADCNGDGVINAFDIDPFVELLTGP